jgi:glucose-6-phosphate 1-dehydrogenase
MLTSKAKITVRERLCIESQPDPCGMVIFGASGDLAHRKILPSLFSLCRKKLLDDTFYILGCGRTSYSDEEFRDTIRESLASHFRKDDTCKTFLDRCFYLSGDYSDPGTYTNISQRLGELDQTFNTGKNHLYYLSVPPSLYAPAVQKLSDAGLTREHTDMNGWVRVVVEKPHGRDLDSARELSSRLRAVLDEHQIYRIDHYLGKETVQNILMFRFANILFEPVWNHQYIDHVQITVTESLGIGSRAGYFEQAGLLRDMFQNHMMQLLALVAMEPPQSFDANHIRDEKAKLLNAVRPVADSPGTPAVLRAQYTAGTIDDQPVPGYRQEKNVAPDSQVETYVAAKVLIDNWRWSGIPFYLRSGKRLMCKKTEIAVVFRHVPYSLFTPLGAEDLEPNTLVFTVQPDEGLALTIQAKRPGPKLCISDMNMDVSYEEAFETTPPEAYERLLLDCMLGDQTLFIRDDDVNLTWALWTPVLEAWQNNPDIPLYTYRAGTWGPGEAGSLVQNDNRRWRDLCLWCDQNVQ